MDDDGAGAREDFRTAEVVSVDRRAGRYALVATTRPADFRFDPAQVVELLVEGEAAFYALASAPEDPELSFVVRSPDSPVARLPVGGTLGVRGPYGKGYAFDVGSDLAFCGIGTAYGALRSGVRHALASGHDPERLSLVLGLRRWADLPAPEELVDWGARGVRLRLAFSAPGADDLERARRAGVLATEGRLYKALGALDVTETVACLAGSEEAEAALALGLRTLGLSDTQIQCNFRPDYRDAR